MTATAVGRDEPIFEPPSEPAMRLVTFELPTRAGLSPRVGALDDDGAVIDLAVAREARMASRQDASGQWSPGTLIGLLREGGQALQAAEAALDFALAEGCEEWHSRRVRYGSDEVALLPPLPRPNSIRNFSLIEEHLLAAIETMKKRIGGNAPAISGIPAEWYNMPAYFKSSVEEVYGPDDVVPWPSYTDKLDFELELAVVIGKPGRGISAANAREHIAGYTLYNDWSARDLQQREMSINLGPGICKDFASSLGPCIATPEEFDLDSAEFRVRVDGEEWSSARLTMRIGFEEVIEAISEVQTLMPGDVLTSGTVSGGCGVEFDRWIHEESVVELEADGIGVLRNQVGRKGEPVELPVSQRLGLAAPPGGAES